MNSERKNPYKEDSTKGMSMINPLNYKGDVLVQVWVDSRVLATLSRWLEEHGTYTTYMSQVVRRPLEILVDLVVNSGDAKLVDSTVEARELLSRRYGIDLNRGGRGTKNVMHNIELSIRREDLAEFVERDKRVNDISRPLRINQNPEIAAKVEEARKKYKELFPSEVGQLDTEQPENIHYEEPIKERVIKSEDAAEFINKRVCDSPLRLNTTREESMRRLEKINEEDKKKLNELNSFDPMSLMGKAIKDKTV